MLMAENAEPLQHEPTYKSKSYISTRSGILLGLSQRTAFRPNAETRNRLVAFSSQETDFHPRGDLYNTN
jgi:hypothetical protein